MSSVEMADGPNSRLLQDDSPERIDSRKPQFNVGDPKLEEQNPGETLPELPHHRYWVRPLVAIFIPAIVTSYYAVIWVHLVQGLAHDEAVKYRTFSGSLIFYSWFIIGVFGLSWSKYGLVGVEASMLRSPFWAAPNLTALLMHSNGTWSSPSGWIKAIRNRQFHRLWSLLAFLSVLPFIALPLSGLVFEISDGYIKVSDVPSVIGRNTTTFNLIYNPIEDHMKPTEAAWSIGAALSIPGFGVIYTNKSLDRSNHSDFEKMPNTLPLTEAIPDLFLAPQADKPVSGTTWGLRVKYDCSVVRSASQFTILSEKPASSIISTTCGTDKCIMLQTPSKNLITLWNSTATNVNAYFEIGSSGTPSGLDGRYTGDHPDFEADEGPTSLVFEYAMWQYRANVLSDDRYSFNTTVAPSIQGMGSPLVKSNDNAYRLNQTFFGLKGDVIDGFPYKNRTTDASKLMDWDRIIDGDAAILDLAAPVGVRCVASSGLGTAKLDGMTSTFDDFRRSDPDFGGTFASMRFGYAAENILNGQFLQHYVAAGLPATQPGNFSPRYPQFLDANSLLRSMNLAYAMDAFSLMYGVKSGFKTEWPEAGLTSSRKGKILSVASLIPGATVGYLVLALLCVWSALSAGLGLWYGFRRRPADRLDGYTMLRKGAEMADELKGNAEFMSGKPSHGNGTLAALRGS